jgi:hypothetical protein|tara:strand:+ start:446 stop:661 length:216 start_codon:yes stop_codon:yes gene_type:complete
MSTPAVHDGLAYITDTSGKFTASIRKQAKVSGYTSSQVSSGHPHSSPMERSTSPVIAEKSPFSKPTEIDPF